MLEITLRTMTNGFLCALCASVVNLFDYDYD
jgi:hypothetical protein